MESSESDEIIIVALYHLRQIVFSILSDTWVIFKGSIEW